MQWRGLANGELLRRAAEEYDVFLTVDRGVRHQQRIPATLTLVTMYSIGNRIVDLLPLVPSLLDALRDLRPGETVDVRLQA
jgi:hypothetical protein